MCMGIILELVIFSASYIKRFSTGKTSGLKTTIHISWHLTAGCDLVFVVHLEPNTAF